MQRKERDMGDHRFIILHMGQVRHLTTTHEDRMEVCSRTAVIMGTERLRNE